MKYQEYLNVPPPLDGSKERWASRHREAIGNVGLLGPIQFSMD